MNLKSQQLPPSFVWIKPETAGIDSKVLRSELPPNFSEDFGILDQLSKPDIAWLAGFFEGEGSVLLVHRLKSRKGVDSKSYTVSITISQRIREPIDWMRDIVGNGWQLYSTQAHTKKNGLQTYWALHTSSFGPASVFLRAIVPCCKFRKAEFSAALAFAEFLVLCKSTWKQRNAQSSSKRMRGAISILSDEMRPKAEELYSAWQQTRMRTANQ